MTPRGTLPPKSPISPILPIPPTKPLAPQDLRALKNCWHDLHGLFRQSYWSAKDNAERDALTALGDACLEVILQLDRHELEANNESFKQLHFVISAVNDKLDRAKAELNRLTCAVTIATQIANGIAKAVKLAAGLGLA